MRVVNVRWVRPWVRPWVWSGEAMGLVCIMAYDGYGMMDMMVFRHYFLYEMEGPSKNSRSSW